VEQRIQEAGRLGFETIYISKYKSDLVQGKKFDIEIKTLTKIDDLLNEVFA
jgi:DNA repair protein RadA/Sms